MIYRSRALVLLALCLGPTSAFAQNSCLSVFQTTSSYLWQSPLSQIYAGQHSVGQGYALIKALRDAGISPNKQLSDLTNKERKLLLRTVRLAAEERVPAVIAPDGRIFILDGHHDLFMLTRFGLELSEISINLHILKDFRFLGLTMNEFKTQAAQERWFYGPSIDRIVDTPLRLADLTDSPQRSQVGLAFRYITKEINTDFRARHFAPFVQFYLIDLMRAYGEPRLTGSMSNRDVKALANAILSGRPSLDFLLNDLRSEAPATLRDFLSERLESSPP